MKSQIRFHFMKNIYTPPSNSAQGSPPSQTSPWVPHNTHTSPTPCVCSGCTFLAFGAFGTFATFVTTLGPPCIPQNPSPPTLALFRHGTPLWVTPPHTNLSGMLPTTPLTSPLISLTSLINSSYSILLGILHHTPPT